MRLVAPAPVLFILWCSNYTYLQESDLVLASIQILVQVIFFTYWIAERAEVFVLVLLAYQTTQVCLKGIKQVQSEGPT